MAVKMTLKKQRNTLLMQKSHRLHVHFVGKYKGRVWFSNNADDFIYGKGRFDGNIGKHGAKT